MEGGQAGSSAHHVGILVARNQADDVHCHGFFVNHDQIARLYLSHCIKPMADDIAAQ